MFKSKSIWGPWEQLPSPFRGEGAEKSFRSQGTYIFKIEGTDEYIFMADRWMPRSLKYSRHIWLPITFDANGYPTSINHDGFVATGTWTEDNNG